MPTHGILEGVDGKGAKLGYRGTINRNVKKQIGVNYAIRAITPLGIMEMN